MSRNSRGRRYEEPKLNIKKVIAVILAIIVFIICIFIIKGLLTKDNETGKISSLSYFSSFKDNKWGVIDSFGNIVIDPSYQEMIIIPNSKKEIFLCTYDVNYDTGEYKTKAINSKNEEILTGYDKIEAIQNKDGNNNLWYEDNVLKIQKDGKYGLINYDGKELLKNEYDSIVPMEGIKNALIIEKNGKFGISDNEGKIILDPIYLEIINLGKDNKSGYIIKKDNNLYGIIDYSKNEILESKYDNISKIHGNDLYVVTEAGKRKLIGKEGQDIQVEGFDEITEILKTQGEGFIYIKDGKYGVMNLNGENIIQPEYEAIKESKQGIFLVKKDGKMGIIDKEKNEKIPFQYNLITYNELADIYIAEDDDFYSSIINNQFEIKQKGILIKIDTDKGYFELRQDDEYKYYNFKFEEKQAKEILTSNTLFISKKDGKYGFIDRDGKVVVDYIYDDATEQNSYGFVAVKKDGKWGSLNNKGETVAEPVYELDDYLLIDFIGRWHLGKDINMNYYNQI